ncbi:MAG: outer membrane protein assembly factor BamA [Myxococcota bacterium]
MPGFVWAQEVPPDAPLAEESNERIVEIRVEGTRRVEAEAVKRALRNKEGRVFDPAKTADDLRSLWALSYFSDIQLLVQRLPTGGIVYVVRVEERPAVREVRLSGNEELSREDLKDAIDIRPFSILDLDVVRRNAKKIQEKYVEKGFFLAEVTHRIDPIPESSEVDVVFVIREHAKVMVKEIRFLGAVKVDASELKDVMATREGSYLSFLTNEGTFREELFQRDLAMVQAAYYDRGFINAKVDKPLVSITPDKRFIYITLKVEEGEQYTIGKLDFSGELIVSKERLGELMTSREGELFNRTKLSRDILAITDIYYDDGYAYANITPVTQVNAEARTIDLTFDVQKGKQVFVERIDVVGNTKTRDTVIRRELRIYEGELFSGTGMRRSKDRVTALGFFETVDVSHKPGSDPQHVTVQVEVKEKATGTFQVGLGFSNVENFIFTAQVSQNNFLGWGWSVAASAQLSGLRSFVQLSFFDPHFFDTNYIFSLDFFRVQSDFFGFLRNSTGGNLNLGYHVLEDVMVNATYTQEHVQVEPGSQGEDITLAGRFRNGVTSSLRLSATWDKRDNRLFPSKGWMLYGSTEYAPKWLFGSFLFLRHSAYARGYVPLPFLGLVFKTNATFGLVQPLEEDSLSDSENYYLGGINTVRGYILRTIGPTEVIGEKLSGDAGTKKFVVGGTKQAIFNFELEFPIFEKVGIRGVVFYDAGNAYGPDEQFFQDRQQKLPLGLYHSVGFGFRWFSPIGPLRFEWGIPLNTPPDPSNPGVLFEFTIGNFF